MTYAKMGTLSVVPAADLISLTAPVNIAGDNRFTANGSHGVGKRAGMLVIRDSGTPGATQYSLVFARGDTPGALWSVVDGSASYTPV